MGFRYWMLATVVSLALPAAAIAQDETTKTDQTTTTTTTESATPAPQTTTTEPATTQTQTTQTTITYKEPPREDEWLFSASLGSDFGLDANNTSINFGAEVGHLWNRMVGVGVRADFTPRFQINNAQVAGKPDVNSYMLNAIGALPLGPDGIWRPYVSAGFGGIQMRADRIVLGGGTTSANQTKWGTNIGAGVYAFAHNAGVRGDIRYFRAFGDNVTDVNTAGENFASSLLSGLDFWRANVGIAFRW